MISALRSTMRTERLKYILPVVVFCLLAVPLAETKTLSAQDTPAENPAAAASDAPPYPHRLRVPEFPRDAQWLNTGGPLRMKDLKGKFVLLDFWTYCCINCIHILPELKKLEKAYPNELVVIGVHSAKFDTEKDSKNIEEAILRYEIEHPVLNDAGHEIWNTYGVRSWPTVLLIDPEGMACWGTGGEITFEQVDKVIKAGLPYYRKKGLLDQTPIRFDLLANRQPPKPLRFPGKVLADAASERLFISDSNHNRIVISTLAGELLDVIGSGTIGSTDGPFEKAAFNHPQGMALHGETLYVADTENHLLRKVDLTSKVVTTIAGTGSQRRGLWPGLEGVTNAADVPERFVGPPKTTALNSPWALLVHQQQLYIAMAGPHQIWKMPLDETEIGPYAGNGREDIVDGPLLPPLPYEQGFSSFAQPSGLASDGNWLFVADSEGSSIRAVPFDPRGNVRTVVGTSKAPFNRLFIFGDRDGKKEQVLLQHPLGVVYHDGTIFVADTYNNKVKAVDAKTGETKTIAGTGAAGFRDDEPTFDEPEGISFANGVLYVADTNNHAIRTIDLDTGRVRTLTIRGLTAPTPSRPPSTPAFGDTDPIALPLSTLKPVDGKIQLRVHLEFTPPWKLNDLAPVEYSIESSADGGQQPLFAAESLGVKRIDRPQTKFDIELPVEGRGKTELKLSLNYFYCQQGGEGFCKLGSVVWTAPLQISDSAKSSNLPLKLEIKD